MAAYKSRRHEYYSCGQIIMGEIIMGEIIITHRIPHRKMPNKHGNAM